MQKLVFCISAVPGSVRADQSRVGVGGGAAVGPATAHIVSAHNKLAPTQGKAYNIMKSLQPISDLFERHKRTVARQGGALAPKPHSALTWLALTQSCTGSSPSLNVLVGYGAHLHSCVLCYSQGVLCTHAWPSLFYFIFVCALPIFVCRCQHLAHLGRFTRACAHSLQGGACPLSHLCPPVSAPVSENLHIYLPL